MGHVTVLAKILTESTSVRVVDTYVLFFVYAALLREQMFRRI